MNKRALSVLLFVFLLLSTFSLLPERMAFAQGGVNIFEKKGRKNPNAPPKPKADESTSQRLNESLRRQFSPEGLMKQRMIYYILFFILLAAVVGVLIYYDGKYRRWRLEGFESPKMLFGDLCRAHRLTRSERTFLTELADRSNLSNPLPLFIEPQHYFIALEGEETSSTSRQTILYFLEKLFDLKPGEHPLLGEAPNGTSSDSTDSETALFPAP